MGIRAWISDVCSSDLLGCGRIVNIALAMVKMPNPVLSMSVAARLGLTGFVSGIAPTYIARGVTINNLLPEQFDTERLRKNLTFIAEKNGISLDEEITKQTGTSPAGRFGRPEEFGATCAFLCSAHAGYMTGQNILLKSEEHTSELQSLMRISYAVFC